VSRRNELKREIAELQAKIDDPETPRDDVRELRVQVDARVTELRTLQQASPIEPPQEAAVLAGLLDVKAYERAGQRAAELVAALPCAGARVDLEAADERGDDAAAVAAAIAGAAACDAAGARATCGWSKYGWCSQKRVDELYETVDANIKAGRLPEREAKLLRAHFTRGRGRSPLRHHDALRVARAIHARRSATIAPGGGDHGVLAAPVTLRGDEVLFVFHGPTGAGKTLAAAYLVARMGGIYVTSYDFVEAGMRPELPTKAQLEAAPVLVIDQVGREHSVSEHGPTMFERVGDARYAAERITIFIGNFAAARDFEDRYDGADADGEGVIADRMRGAGAYVAFRGKSLRGWKP
jgi:hypothetical protein